jgi:hypothetical protein
VKNSEVLQLTYRRCADMLMNLATLRGAVPQWVGNKVKTVVEKFVFGS